MPDTRTFFSLHPADPVLPTFGFNTSGWQHPKTRAKRNYFYAWHERRGLIHERDLVTFTDDWDGFPTGVTYDYSHAVESYGHGFERGHDLLCVLFHFTRPALGHLSKSQQQSILGYPSVNGNLRYAGKLAYSLGMRAHHPGMIQFSKEWEGKQLERLAPLNGPNLIIETRNEYVWEPVDPRATKAQYADLAPFAESIGLKYVDESQFAASDERIREAGFKVLEPASVHGYYTWYPAGERITRGYLNHPEEGAWWMTETGVDPREYRYAEARKLIYDATARGAERIYIHSPGLISKARKYWFSNEGYEQFKDPEIARTWLGSDPAPHHEGGMVLDARYDEQLTGLIVVA